MKLQELADQKEIVIVCGNFSSGKGHYIQQHYPDSEYMHIGVSAIVKTLSGFKTRSELGTTANLDSVITQKIFEYIDKHKRVVIDGIRQPQILQAIVNRYGSQVKDIIWLDVPEQERRERFEKRASKKDDMSFDKSIQSDKELGIDDVEAYIRKHGRVIPY